MTVAVAIGRERKSARASVLGVGRALIASKSWGELMGSRRDWRLDKPRGQNETAIIGVSDKWIRASARVGG
jgi:hypothetical protein